MSLPVATISLTLQPILDKILRLVNGAFRMVHIISVNFITVSRPLQYTKVNLNYYIMQMIPTLSTMCYKT